MPVSSDEYWRLKVRRNELRPKCSADWLAAIGYGDVNIMDSDTSKILEAVDLLQLRIKKWEEPVREFWQKNAITTATRRAEKKLIASLKAQWDPQPELDNLFRQCAAVTSNSMQILVRIRQFVSERQFLSGLIYGHALNLADQIKSLQDVAKFKVAVTTVSILNGACDWRDLVYVVLGLCTSEPERMGLIPGRYSGRSRSFLQMLQWLGLIVRSQVYFAILG